MANYWKTRENEYYKSIQATQEQITKRLETVFDSTKKSIQSDIDGFLGRYASREGITVSEANKLVKAVDIKDLQLSAKELFNRKELTPDAKKRLKLYNLKTKMSRLEVLKSRIDLEVIDNYSKVQNTINRTLVEQAIAEYTRQSGLLGMTINHQEKNLALLINQSFYGATWSTRIWGEEHAEKMRADLGTVLNKIMVTKNNPYTEAGALARRWEKELGLKMGERTQAAGNLLISEAARLQTEVKKDSFTQAGVAKYEYYAEPTACKICAPLDGQIFLVSEMDPGENAKPMHPRCYCGVLPVSERADWLADLEARAEAYNSEID